jgi:hypothetical protein
MTAPQNQKHPHHDVILAYLEGKAIEYLHINGEGWFSYTERNNYQTRKCMPAFPANMQFRVKSEGVKIRLLLSGIYIITYIKNFSALEDSVAEKREARPLEADEKWLTDWVDFPQLKPLSEIQKES